MKIETIKFLQVKLGDSVINNFTGEFKLKYQMWIKNIKNTFSIKIKKSWISSLKS